MYELPIIHLALLYRCNLQSVGGMKSATLLEEELGNTLDFEAISEEFVREKLKENKPLFEDSEILGG